MAKKMNRVLVYKDPMISRGLILFRQNSSFSHFSRIHSVAGEFFGEGLPRIEWLQMSEIEDLPTKKLFRFSNTFHEVANKLRMW